MLYSHWVVLLSSCYLCSSNVNSKNKTILAKVQKQAYLDGKPAKLSSNKLVYKGRAYTVNSIYDAGLEVAKISERRNENKVKFYGRFSLLSNFYPVALSYKGIHFHSAEQLYHYKRAEELGNQTLAFDIAMTEDPAECKQLTKDIPRDNERDNRIMRTVILQKFSIPKFRTFLKATGTAELIECNPYDRYWSCGCSLDMDLKDANGKNMLGIIIGEFRKTLK